MQKVIVYLLVALAVLFVIHTYVYPVFGKNRKTKNCGHKGCGCEAANKIESK